MSVASPFIKEPFLCSRWKQYRTEEHCGCWGQLSSNKQSHSVAVNHRDNKLCLTQAHGGGVRTKINRWVGQQSKMKPEQKT